MKNFWLFVVLTVLVSQGCNRTQPSADSYIPYDLDDAHAQLIANLPPTEIERIKTMPSEDGMSDYHFGLGMSLRNRWGLWSNSRLAKYFHKMGVHHADDMSGIILDTLWCKLHDKPFDLDGRVRYYTLYWKVQAGPTEHVCPACKKRICFWANHETKTNIVPVGCCEGCLEVWAYDFNTGWHKATPEILDIVETWRRKSLGLDKGTNGPNQQIQTIARKPDSG